MSEEKPSEDQTPPNVKRMKVEELLQMLQNDITLEEGSSEKARQRILDKIFNVIGQYAKMSESQGKEITLLKAEIERLQRLCKEHNIDSSPPKEKPKNRAERRKEVKAAKKESKKEIKKEVK